MLYQYRYINCNEMDDVKVFLPQTPLRMKKAGLHEQTLSKQPAFASAHTSRASHGCSNGILIPFTKMFKSIKFVNQSIRISKCRATGMLTTCVILRVVVGGTCAHAARTDRNRISTFTARLARFAQVLRQRIRGRGCRLS